MSFAEAVQTVLVQKYADFSGRASRSEYWWYALFVFLVNLVTNVIDRGLGNQVVGLLVSLALLLPGLGVAARRLHDTGRSAWWLLLILAIVVGWIVLLVFYLQDSQEGSNQYGPNPKGPQGYVPPTPGYGPIQ